MISNRLRRLALLVLPLAATMAEQAAAEDIPGALPGVDEKAGDKVVAVKPLSSTEQYPTTENDGWVRMGDWDVKISGSVRVDIGAGGRRPVRSDGGR